MYEYIAGKVVEAQPKGLVLDNHGIGYFLNVANPYRFQVGAEQKVYTYLAVREDAQDLYGFETKEEKSLFLKLIGVTGIGPKSALAILAVADGAGLAQAIENEDVKYLTKFPGIGKKTAGQLVLDLKGKLGDFAQEVALPLETMLNDNQQALEDAMEALVTLGYSAKEVKKIHPKLEKEQAATADEYLRLAFKFLMK